MEIVLGAAIVLVALLLFRGNGFALSGLLGQRVGAPAPGAPGGTGLPPGAAPIVPPGVVQAAGQMQQASTAWGSQTMQAAQAGSLQTLQGGIGIGSGIATTAVGMATGAIGMTAGAATMGIGAVAGIAVMLWQEHELRMKDATNENSAWNVIYPDWLQSVVQIIGYYNAGQINGQTASAELDQLRALVLQDAQKFQNEPGISWSGGNVNGSPVGMTGSQKIWQVTCNKSCTIGCCLFNGIVGPNTERAKALVTGQQVAVFATGQMQMVNTNSFVIPALPPNPTYGFNGAPATPIQANPPASGMI